MNDLEEDPLNFKSLKNLMHDSGIPLRYLGKICMNTFFNHTREIAVIEIISRTAKILIKDGLFILSE